MRRRQFVGGFAATAIGSGAAISQQATGRAIGFLHVGTAASYVQHIAAFQKGLDEGGYAVGKNLEIEYRWAEGERERLPALARDLVQRGVSVIAANPSSAASAAKAVTTSVPIVFTSAFDPVKLGLVASLNHPGGNITGISQLSGELGSKRFELLRELVPKARVIALLTNPGNLNAEPDTRELQAISLAMGQQLIIVNARNTGELDTAFTTLVQQGAGALIVSPDVVFLAGREQIVALAKRHAVPTIYNQRAYVVSGGLISYGASDVDGYRQSGIYVARILRGASPADLPVLQPTKFELILNVKTARALGLTVPLTLQAAADEVFD
ncbi:MAG: ABC transporter substrate-binding protein [Xanthobacteraceae bacterium]